MTSTARSGSTAPREPLRPRRTSHRGRPLARALLIDTAHDDAVQRALTALSAQRGARLFYVDRTDGSRGANLLVVYADQMRLDTAQCDGAVLVDEQGALSAAPLAREERARVPDGAIVTVGGGVAWVTARQELQQFPAGALFDLDAFAPLAVVPLGVPPPPPEPPPPPPIVDARRALLGETAPNAQRDQVAADLRDRDPRMPPAPGPQAPQGAPTDGPVDQGALARALDRDAQGAPVDGAGDAMMRWLARQGERLGLLERVRQRTREYVEETLRMLRDGKIDEGLLRAIPLSSRFDTAPPVPSVAGIPAPRANLSIGAGGGRARGPSIIVEQDVFAALRRTYREAAKKLIAERRFREAAFVHIELLEEVAEGVAILERSADPELLRLAAEVAESRRLPAPVVVRQWLLAKDNARAIAHARRHRAFAPAIHLLEQKGHRELAGLLRMEHADLLARVGSFSEAVSLLWPLRNEHRGVVRRLLEDGIEAHARGRAELIARSALLDAQEGRTPRVLPAIRHAIRYEGHDGADVRTTLARELDDDDARKQLGPVLAELARAILVDEAEGRASPGSFKRAVEASRDRVLRTDAPTVDIRHTPPRESIDLRGSPGTAIAADTAILPGGRVLCALGEAGCVLLAPDGHIVATFAEPAHSLCVSDNGASAIGISRRGDVLRTCRIDLKEKRAARWIDVRAVQAARSYDGEWFFVARDNGDVLMLDALADTPKVGAQLALDGVVMALTRGRDALVAAVMTPEDEQVSLVRHDLPSLNRVFAQPLPWQGPERVAALSLQAVVLDLDGVGAVWPESTHTPNLQDGVGVADLDDLTLAYTTQGLEPNVVLVRRGTRRMRVVVHDAAVIGLRLAGALLAISDDVGRIFVVDVERGWLVSPLRIP